MLKNIIEKYSEQLLLLNIVIWVILILYIKFGLFAKNVIYGDIFIYMNSFYNTNFIDEWLYTDFNNEFGITSYFSDHFAPTLLIIIPIYKVFNSAIFLIFLQSLMPCLSTILLYKLSKEITKNIRGLQEGNRIALL